MNCGRNCFNRSCGIFITLNTASIITCYRPKSPPVHLIYMDICVLKCLIAATAERVIRTIIKLYLVSILKN